MKRCLIQKIDVLFDRCRTLYITRFHTSHSQKTVSLNFVFWSNKTNQQIPDWVGSSASGLSVGNIFTSVVNHWNGASQRGWQEEKIQILLANFIASTWCLCWNPTGVLLKAEVSGSRFQRCSHKGFHCSLRDKRSRKQQKSSAVGLLVRAVAVVTSFGWLYQSMCDQR